MLLLAINKVLHFTMFWYCPVLLVKPGDTEL